MRITKISNTCQELSFENADILISYQTIVGLFIPTRGFYITDEYHSVTTTKHIKLWLQDRRISDPIAISQDTLDNIKIAIEIPDMEAKTDTIINQYGHEIDFESAVNLMDDNLRELLHNLPGSTDASPQEFFDAYCLVHRVKFGGEWELDKPNPVY